ncbi:MAG: CDP-alcohol phosphatidyltransferase family protein, partial [Leptolyngbyaceae cyanobacterium MO_188.B28]|nr:CDP-alcohol phosphatidyltransferase family protein [Leptolyngbyaceae cyanobacterium MO_188.B28]
MEPNIVFSFIPNVIGYVRIVLYAVGFIAHVVGYWQCCLVFYLVAFFLDELDGLAAKKFNQQSQFGAALDMVTDRAATTGFCLIISQLYPSYLLGFILL